MARTYGRRTGPANDLAQVWDSLPVATQAAIRAQVRDALRQVPRLGGTTGQKPAAPGKTSGPYKKHVRYQGGGVVVLASARRPPISPQQQARIDRAWQRLTDDTQKGQR